MAKRQRPNRYGLMRRAKLAGTVASTLTRPCLPRQGCGQRVTIPGRGRRPAIPPVAEA